MVPKRVTTAPHPTMARFIINYWSTTGGGPVVRLPLMSLAGADVSHGGPQAGWSRGMAPLPLSDSHQGAER